MTELNKQHPLVMAATWAEQDALEGHLIEQDHGSWDGRWTRPSAWEVAAMQEKGGMWPTGSGDHEVTHEALTTAASGKELRWGDMDEETRDKFREAAADQWSKWIENGAVQILNLSESEAIRRDLERKGEGDRILEPRFVLTDKNSGLRTDDRPLPLKANARLIVPGFKDLENLQGELRKDAPTASRISQHVIASVSAQHPDWALLSADVRAAFLKGDPYVARQLYMTGTNPRKGPTIPIPLRGLAKVLKGIFGLADAPREWYLRLARELADEGWLRSVLDLAMWYYFEKGGGLRGALAAHVDDLLMTGDKDAVASLHRLGDKLGCGKRFEKDMESGTVTIDMETYHKQLKPVVVQRERRSTPESALTPVEVRQCKGILGSLQWLVAQVRFDLAFEVSTLQSESPPTVGTLLRANKCLLDAKRNGDFRLTFRGINYQRGGILVVTDAALGNVSIRGCADVETVERIASQSCYAVLLADEQLMKGERGKFNLLDFRSHRLARVCRSSYAAETLGAEEGLDAGELCRGFIAELRKLDMACKKAFFKVCEVGLLGVTDAKDSYDKLTKDTGFGTQKSLAFTLAALRQQLRRPNTKYRWTATANMFVDAGTKRMSTDKLRQTLERGEWSVIYTEEFVRQTAKKKKPAEITALLPGRGVQAGDDDLLRHVYKFAEMVGWHYVDGVGVHVAHGAKSLRGPQPRFSLRDYPYRTSVGSWRTSGSSEEWRVIEEKVDMRDLPNLQEQLASRASRLVTFFSRSSSK